MVIRERRPLGAANPLSMPTDNGTWEHPVSCITGGLPPAPAFKLSWLRSAAPYVEQAAEAANVVPEQIVGALLASMSTALGNVFVKPWDGWQEGAILYVGNPAFASQGKTRASRAVLGALRRAMTGIIALPLSQEGGAPVRITSDISRRSLLDLLAGGPLLLHWDEAPSAEHLRDLRNLLLRCFDGDQFTYNRHGEPSIDIKKPHLSVVLNVQPDLLARIFGGADDGLLSRFLFFLPAAHEFRRPTKAPDGQRIEQAIQFALVNANPEQPLILSLAGDGADWFEKAVPRLKAGPVDGTLASANGKFPGLVLRLAAVLEWLEAGMADEPTVPEAISRASLFAALAMVGDYFKPAAAHVHAAINPSGHPPEAALAEWLCLYQPRVLNGRLLKRGQEVPGISGAAADQALAGLVRAGWLRPVTTSGKPGRPSSDFEVNPAATSEKEIV